ncbi:MAG: hypothetical protein MJ058_03965 [Akkermansia sp.]|nr:hypothetical protein [Akkermansia sp.]
MKKGRKKRSPRHTTPPEFAEAEKAHGTRRWKERMARLRERQERLRSVKMPAHPAPLTDEQWWAKQKF